MDWPVLVVGLLVALAVAWPLWRLQRRAGRDHATAPVQLDNPAEPGSEGMNVPRSGEVAPGPDETAR